MPLHGDIVGCGDDRSVFAPLFILVSLQGDIVRCGGNYCISTPCRGIILVPLQGDVVGCGGDYCVFAPSTIVLNGYMVIVVEMAY